MGKPRIIVRPSSILTKQVGQLKKLFGLHKSSEKQNKINPPTYRKEGTPNFLAQRQGLDTKFVTRRQIVMNRHFTEIISDVLSNSITNDLTQLGVTITSIESKAWNKGVDVFYHTNEGFNEIKQNKLESIIRDLRASVTERRLIGRTPVINFVLDRSIASDRKMETAFMKAKEISKEPILDQLVKPMANNLDKGKRANQKVSGLTPHSFSAPEDMSNSMFGLDYPKLYDQVVDKMERGRALSLRTRPSDNIVLSAPPLIRGPPPDVVEDNPVKRIADMQKFLINQRKKAERLGKQRRLEEILARDANRWEYPEQNNEEQFVE